MTETEEWTNRRICSVVFFFYKKRTRFHSDKHSSIYTGELKTEEQWWLDEQDKKKAKSISCLGHKPLWEESLLTRLWLTTLLSRTDPGLVEPRVRKVVDELNRNVQNSSSPCYTRTYVHYSWTLMRRPFQWTQI